MKALFDILPGMKMPVSAVIPALTKIWRIGDSETETQTSFHASKVNLILHFGLAATEKEALDIFHTACRFAINHPSRIIVLCPVENQHGEEILEGKLYSQCFLGPGEGNVSCCDALILGYPTTESGFLENQVSIWLESDLPTYHWFHRVPVKAIRDYYLSFVEDFRRVVFDSSVEGNLYNRINWPALVVPSDLAYARSLPYRQSIGQFLSRFEPSLLRDGLNSVVVKSSSALDGEAAGLLRWQRSCLKSCGFGCKESEESEAAFQLDPSLEEEEQGLSIDWIYGDEGRFFSWRFSCQTNVAQIKADFGKGRHTLNSHLNLPDFEESLAEALFF